jgi:hypothetical protein
MDALAGVKRMVISLLPQMSMSEFQEFEEFLLRGSPL